jgi:transposase-like protein
MRVILGWLDAEKSVKPLETGVIDRILCLWDHGRTTAALVGVNKSTAAYYFLRLRMIITQTLAEETPFAGAIEVDESYFGGHRKGKRGRGAAGKVPVFGILKRGGRVYTQVIPDTKAKTLLGIMQDRIVPVSIVYTTPIDPIMFWMCQSLNTIGSTIRSGL